VYVCARTPSQCGSKQSFGDTERKARQKGLAGAHRETHEIGKQHTAEKTGSSCSNSIDRTGTAEGGEEREEGGRQKGTSER